MVGSEPDQWQVDLMGVGLNSYCCKLRLSISSKAASGDFNLTFAVASMFGVLAAGYEAEADKCRMMPLSFHLFLVISY